MNLVSLVIFLSLLLFAQIGCSVETTEQAPTSQPTVFFIAPSVPEDGYDTNAPIPIVMSTTHPTISPSGAQDGTGSTIDNELAEETRTAINTSSYIFYTFIGLIGCIGAAYLVKRYVVVLIYIPQSRSYFVRSIVQVLCEWGSTRSDPLPAGGHSRPGRVLLQTQHRDDAGRTLKYSALLTCIIIMY